jgi:hypothetical protein
MPGAIRYDIFKRSARGRVLYVETIKGLAPATNRIEELATDNPMFDYFLYSLEVGVVVRVVRRTSPSPVGFSNAISQKKAG